MKLKYIQRRFPLNIQFFAEVEDDTQDTDKGIEQEKGQTKSFDDLLKDKVYQSEFDKRIAKALETAKGKWQMDQEKALETAKTEAEKLAKMNVEQKAQYEAEKREEEYKKRLDELNARELKATARETLASEGLPLELAEVLNYTDVESCNKSIDAIKTAFLSAVGKAVNEKLGETAPPKRGNSTEDAETEKLRKIMGL